jgi:hypothetical protein
MSYAGDKDQAGRTGRQQRGDLVLVGGVIEQDQHLLAGQPIPENRRPGCEAFRDPLGRYPEQPQERLQRRGCRYRSGARREPPRIGVKLPVAVPTLGDQPMRGVYREPGLAHTGHALHGGDHHRSTLRITAGLEHCGQFRAPAGEIGDVGRQLPVRACRHGAARVGLRVRP